MWLCRDHSYGNDAATSTVYVTADTGGHPARPPQRAGRHMDDTSMCRRVNDGDVIDGLPVR